MTRLILVGLLFLFSFLVLFRAPTNLLWYVSILVTEFCWVFFCLILVLLFWKFGNPKYHLLTTAVGMAALALYCLPVVQALKEAQKLPKDFEAAFGKKVFTNRSPFNPLRMITGIGAKQVPFKTLTY